MAEKPQSSAYARNKITAENGDAPRTGTALAIIDIIQSCSLAPRHDQSDGHDGSGADITASTARKQWGGARNRADRVSHYLTLRQCESLIAAAEFSVAVKRPFNRHWTVHYERAGIADSDATRFIGHLLKLASAQARREGGQLAALWVRENGNGKGAHVHILMHLPAGMSLRNRTRRWIELAGGKYCKGVSKVAVIGGTLVSAGIDSERHRENVQNVLRYLLKAASKEAGEALGLERYGEGGRIIGKRCGRTQNIRRLVQRR